MTTWCPDPNDERTWRVETFESIAGGPGRIVEVESPTEVQFSAGGRVILQGWHVPKPKSRSAVNPYGPIHCTPEQAVSAWAIGQGLNVRAVYRPGEASVYFHANYAKAQ